MITEKKLLKKGYVKITLSHMFEPYSDFFYQKRFKDTEGIRYFIEFFHYPEKKYPFGAMLDESWKCSLQTLSPHMTFQQHKVESITTAENRCLCFWRSMHCDYYDKYDERKFE